MRHSAVAVIAVTLAAATPPAAAAQDEVLPAHGVTTRPSVNLRTRPGNGRVVARLPRGTRLTVSCQRAGPLARGRLGASRVWDRVTRGGTATPDGASTPDGAAGTPLGTGSWVADGFLDTGTRGLVAPLCNAPSRDDTALLSAGTGLCTLTAPVAPLPPFATPQALIAAALPGAKASRAAYRVPVAVTLAQTILETGGGRFTAGANNFFGLKAQATTRPGRFAFGPRAAGCVLRKTREAERGRLVITIGAFRAYATLEESILDHGERLTVNPVYRAAFAHTQSPRRFAQIIARHYATDRHYAAKLLDLIDRYDLDERG